MKARKDKCDSCTKTVGKPWTKTAAQVRAQRESAIAEAIQAGTPLFPFQDRKDLVTTLRTIGISPSKEVLTADQLKEKQERAVAKKVMSQIKLLHRC